MRALTLPLSSLALLLGYGEGDRELSQKEQQTAREGGFGILADVFGEAVVDRGAELLGELLLLAIRVGVALVLLELVRQLPDGADGTIDWIVLADVYHEMSEPDAMLADIFEVIHPANQPLPGTVWTQLLSLPSGAVGPK